MPLLVQVSLRDNEPCVLAYKSENEPQDQTELSNLKLSCEITGSVDDFLRSATCERVAPTQLTLARVEKLGAVYLFLPKDEVHEHAVQILSLGYWEGEQVFALLVDNCQVTLPIPDHHPFTWIPVSRLNDDAATQTGFTELVQDMLNYYL